MSKYYDEVICKKYDAEIEHKDLPNFLYDASLFISSELDDTRYIDDGICWINLVPLDIIVSYKKDSLITYSKYLFKDIRYMFYKYAVGDKVTVLIEDLISEKIYKISKLGE